MSLPHIEIGQPLEGREQRNPLGWLLFACLAILLIIAQLVAYFTRTPSTDLARVQVEREVQAQLGLQALTSSSPTVRSQVKAELEKSAQKLVPTLGEDPESALLYAALRTETQTELKPTELIALKLSKKPEHVAVFQIYSSRSLDRTAAVSLAGKLPKGKFAYRLAAVQALEKAGVPDARKQLGLEDKTMKLAALALIGAVAFFCGVALVIGYIFVHGAKPIVKLGFPTGWLSGADADRLVMRCAQITVAFQAVPLLASALIGGPLLREYGQVPIYLGVVVIVFLMARVPISGKWISLRSLGLSTENLGKHILWGVAAAIANVPILAIVFLISSVLTRSLPAPEHPATVQLTNSSSPWVVIQILLIAAVFAPLIEEIMFRATLFPALSSVLKSPVWGALISSFIFAAIHPTGIPVWPVLAAFGCMSCFLVYQTKSLVPSMVMHAVHNFGLLMITLLSPSVIR